MLASDVIKQSRYALSDQTGNRWSDARLLSLLNDAIREVAARTKVFNKKGFIPILNNLSTYDISSFATKIRRVEYLGVRLPFYSHDELDDLNFGWRNVVGDKPEAIVYDKDNFGVFKVYPIVENSNFDYLDSNSPYGVIGDLAYEDFEFVPQGDTFGDLDLPASKDYLYIYYILKHPEIVAVTDEVQLDDIYKFMLANFIAAKAFMDNLDTQSIEMAKGHEDAFEDKLKTFVEESAESSTQAKRDATYNPMG